MNSQKNKETSDTSNKKVISVSENFRILRDSMSYTVQQYVTIDPSRNPRLKPEDDVPESRQVWRDEGHYGANVSGLRAALKSIAILSTELKAKDDVHIKEYLKLLKDFTKVINDSVEDSEVE